ncbi:glycerol-3-phosphate acyltransferase [Chloroflexota bacterium]
MSLEFGLLILAAYLLGSLPFAYLTARLAHGIDIRQYGTGQVGGGNLWRMTSWRFGLPVGVFDVAKGLTMVWLAQLIGLSIAHQLVIGLAAIAGHNWPVFLRFNGGRGVGTTLGVIVILPLINDLTPWVVVIPLGITLVGTLVMRSSPVPVLAGVVALSLFSWRFHEPLMVTLGFLGIFLIIVAKRLTAPRPETVASIGGKQLLINRLLFDRDVKDRKVWMHRTPPKAGPTEQLPRQ